MNKETTNCSICKCYGTYVRLRSPKENRMKTVWADKVTLENVCRVIRVLSYNVRNG